MKLLGLLSQTDVHPPVGGQPTRGTCGGKAVSPARAGLLFWRLSRLCWTHAKEK